MSEKDQRSAKLGNETDDCTLTFYGKKYAPSSERAWSTYQATSF